MKALLFTLREGISDIYITKTIPVFLREKTVTSNKLRFLWSMYQVCSLIVVQNSATHKKIKMEPQNGDLEDEFPFQLIQLGEFLGSKLNFRGVTPKLLVFWINPLCNYTWQLDSWWNIRMKIVVFSWLLGYIISGINQKNIKAFGEDVDPLDILTETCLRRKNLNATTATLPETNIASENGPSQKETSIQTIHFQVLG